MECLFIYKKNFTKFSKFQQSSKKCFKLKLKFRRRFRHIVARFPIMAGQRGLAHLAQVERHGRVGANIGRGGVMLMVLLVERIELAGLTVVLAVDLLDEAVGEYLGRDGRCRLALLDVSGRLDELEVA